MVPCRIVVAVIIAVSGPSIIGASISWATQYSSSNALKFSGSSPIYNGWGGTKKQQSATWSFYTDLSYYADPEYFLRCYRRARIETLYWVTWRPIHFCR